MNCPRCNTPSLEGKNYCADCGSPLNPNLTKDQKLVEWETSQAVVERVHGWAKLFAYFIAIPVAVLLLVLGIAGVKTYEDFKGLVHRAEEQVKPRLEQAKASAETASQQ